MTQQSIKGNIMLLHPTLEKLTTLRFTGMVAALDEQMQMSSLDDMSFEERLGILLDREIAVRQTRRMNTRLRKAKLRQDSCIEDIDFRHPRGLDKSLVLRLAGCEWIKERNNVIITGPTGVGKTYLACAFAQKACRQGFNTLYLRMTKLFEDLSLSKGDGRYLKLLSSFAKADLLVLDDYGLDQLGREQRHDLLEILEDRHGLKSTLVTSQLPIDHWHEQICDPTLQMLFSTDWYTVHIK
jgi:DNA replication protein DnaC